MKNGIFTFFGKGHYNAMTKKWGPSVRPIRSVDIPWTYRYITSERAKYATEELRRMLPTASDQEVRDFKLREFDAVAGAGTFSYGAANKLIERSPYIVIDIDDLASTEEARQVVQTLAADRDVETALAFVSPKGRGVKWWAEFPTSWQAATFRDQHDALVRHIGYEYGLQADLNCSNVNRLCLLPYDKECFINPKYL